MIAASLLVALALSHAAPSQEADIGRRANDALPILSEEWTALLCRYVAENLSETDPREARSVYRYRTWFYRAAGVDLAADNADTIRSKMQLWWNANQDAVRCNVPNSVIRNGSILRLAADRSSSEFLPMRPDAGGSISTIVTPTTAAPCLTGSMTKSSSPTPTGLRR